MPRCREYATNAERQAAYRQRRREECKRQEEARAHRQQLLHQATEQFQRAVRMAARMGDGDARVLEKHDLAGQLSLLARWFDERSEQLECGRGADRRKREELRRG